MLLLKMEKVAGTFNLFWKTQIWISHLIHKKSLFLVMMKVYSKLSLKGKLSLTNWSQIINLIKIKTKMRVKKTNLKKILTAIKTKRVINNQLMIKIKILFNNYICKKEKPFWNYKNSKWMIAWMSLDQSVK